MCTKLKICICRLLPPPPPQKKKKKKSISANFTLLTHINFHFWTIETQWQIRIIKTTLQLSKIKQNMKLKRQNQNIIIIDSC